MRGGRSIPTNPPTTTCAMMRLSVTTFQRLCLTLMSHRQSRQLFIATDSKMIDCLAFVLSSQHTARITTEIPTLKPHQRTHQCWSWRQLDCSRSSCCQCPVGHSCSSPSTWHHPQNRVRMCDSFPKQAQWNKHLEEDRHKELDKCHMNFMLLNST